MTTSVYIRVRDANNTYTATSKCFRASSTAGAESAARALAHKVFPNQVASIEFVSRERAIEIWRMSA